MKKKKIIEKKVEMKVAEYVAYHNGSTLEVEKEIDRFDVYKMIKEGKLKAHKGRKGAWILEVAIEEEEVKTKKSADVKEYSVKEFVEIYNEKHPKTTVTVVEVRKLLTDGKLKGKKVNRKWVITASPNSRIK